MQPFLTKWKQRLIDLLEMPQLLREIRLGVANQSSDLARGLNQVKDGIGNQSSDLARGLNQVKDGIADLDDRLDASNKGVPSTVRQPVNIKIEPIADIPFPPVNMAEADPIVAIVGSGEFESATRFFADSPSSQRSLVSPHSQALLYCLIRLLKPQRVVEIGTFMAATTEAMARGLLANETGILETIDPFGRRQVPPILAAWPAKLQRTTVFHGVNSMQFFAEMQQRQQQAELIFVDGNHDFEFALFDIESAGRFLSPNGFIVIDNISQPGPFMASRDFLARHRGWRECGNKSHINRSFVAYDAERTKIENTEFCVLRAPPLIVVDARPMTLGQMPFTKALGGILVEIAQPAKGTLHVQCIVRTFGTPPKEFIADKTFDVTDAETLFRIPLDVAADTAPDTRQTVEPWLTWEGASELRLASVPAIF